MSGTIKAILIIGILGTGGYFIGSKFNMSANFNETNAISMLRHYQTAQFVYQQQSAGNAFAQDINILGNEGMLKEEVVKALDSAPSPTPYRGYLFSVIEPNDTRLQCGLTAYPSEPGSSGNTMFMIFIDSSLIEMSDSGMPSTSKDEVQIWKKPFKAGDKPITEWISMDERKKTCTRFDRPDRSPEDALKEAEEYKRRAMP